MDSAGWCLCDIGRATVAMTARWQGQDLILFDYGMWLLGQEELGTTSLRWFFCQQ